MSVPSTYNTLMHEFLECMSLGFGSPPASTLRRTPQYHDHTGVQKHAHAIANHKNNTEKLSSYIIATYSNESVNLQELLLKLHTLYLEKSPVLFILSIENFSESVEGSGCKQIMQN